MVFNRDLEDVEGNFVARPDGWLDDVGLAWEIDSLRHHLSVPIMRPPSGDAHNYARRAPQVAASKPS